MTARSNAEFLRKSAVIWATASFSGKLVGLWWPELFHDLESNHRWTASDALAWLSLPVTYICSFIVVALVSIGAMKAVQRLSYARCGLWGVALGVYSSLVFFPGSYFEQLDHYLETHYLIEPRWMDAFVLLLMFVVFHCIVLPRILYAFTVSLPSVLRRNIVDE